MMLGRMQGNDDEEDEEETRPMVKSALEIPYIHHGCILCHCLGGLVSLSLYCPRRFDYARELVRAMRSEDHNDKEQRVSEPDVSIEPVSAGILPAEMGIEAEAGSCPWRFDSFDCAKESVEERKSQ